MQRVTSSRSRGRAIAVTGTKTTLAAAKELYALPLLDLLYRAQTVHREFHPPDAVQLCTLLSVKTGACSEDCAYCPQSGRHSTDVEPERLMPVGEAGQRQRRVPFLHGRSVA